MLKRDRISVLIPCYNEELTVGKVVHDFKKALPEATIYVYDNNSSDRTAEIAREAGAVVRFESRQGKGNVVRQMFREIDSDCYVMVDGDDTYPAESVRDLVDPILEGRADMTVGDRLSNGSYSKENKRAFHGFGNKLVCTMIRLIYHYRLEDTMTGYRAFSRTFVKTFPALSPGFQIETELSIHAVDRRFRILDVPIVYRDRPEGSVSKLNTFSDGARVIAMVASLFKNYHPLKLFSLISLVFLVIGLVLGIPVIVEYVYTGLVPRLPTAVLSTALVYLCFLSLATGLILDTVAKVDRKQWELEVFRVIARDAKSGCCDDGANDGVDGCSRGSNGQGSAGGPAGQSDAGIGIP